MKKSHAAPKVIKGKKYISIADAAEVIGVGRTSLSQWAKEGRTKSGFELDIYRDEHSGYGYISEDSMRLLRTNKALVRASTANKFRIPQNLHALDIQEPQTDIPQEKLKFRLGRYPRDGY
jgi:hypothetical protein